jgi:hypothetical protein
MSVTVTARLAGFTFLFYIVAGVANMILFRSATTGDGTVASVLAAMAANAATVRFTVLLTLSTAAAAIILGVTLYSLTRDADRDLALLGLCFRLTEGTVAAVSVVRTLGLLAIATAVRTGNAVETAAAHAEAALLLKQGGWTGLVAATCFAAGSTFFCWLFLRARTIPLVLSWLGVVASLLLVILLPLQLVGFVKGTLANLVWLPMLVFEVVFAFWLLIRGVAAPR